jgi:hypothetical protein
VTDSHPAIIDATVIRVERVDGISAPWTWAAWKAGNINVFRDDEFAEIAAAICDPACRCNCGGGRQPLTYLSREPSA